MAARAYGLEAGQGERTVLEIASPRIAARRAGSGVWMGLKRHSHYNITRPKRIASIAAPVRVEAPSLPRIAAV